MLIFTGVPYASNILWQGRPRLLLHQGGWVKERGSGAKIKWKRGMERKRRVECEERHRGDREKMAEKNKQKKLETKQHRNEVKLLSRLECHCTKEPEGHPSKLRWERMMYSGEKWRLQGLRQGGRGEI